MQFGRTTRLKELADLPTGRELTRDANALALIAFAELPFFMALPFAAPPDIPADRAAALQAAFMAMCRDKDFREEAEKIGFDVSPIDAAEVQRLLTRSAATPRDVIERYNALGEPQKK
jgi:ABC-type phosphate/phosphonate transport system substrate-binding protein